MPCVGSISLWSGLSEYCDRSGGRAVEVSVYRRRASTSAHPPPGSARRPSAPCSPRLRGINTDPPGTVTESRLGNPSSQPEECPRSHDSPGALPGPTGSQAFTPVLLLFGRARPSPLQNSRAGTTSGLAAAQGVLGSPSGQTSHARQRYAPSVFARNQGYPAGNRYSLGQGMFSRIRRDLLLNLIRAQFGESGRAPLPRNSRCSAVSGPSAA